MWKQSCRRRRWSPRSGGRCGRPPARGRAAIRLGSTPTNASEWAAGGGAWTRLWRRERGNSYGGGVHRGRGDGNFCRPKQIVVADHLGRSGLLHRDQIFEWNHHSLSRAHVILTDVPRLRTELLVRLDVNAIGAVVEVEVVHIDRAHVNLQGISNLVQRNLKALGFF